MVSHGIAKTVIVLYFYRLLSFDLFIMVTFFVSRLLYTYKQRQNKWLCN